MDTESEMMHGNMAIARDYPLQSIAVYIEQDLRPFIVASFKSRTQTSNENGGFLPINTEAVYFPASVLLRLT